LEVSIQDPACRTNKKGKGFLYLLPSVGPGADPGVEAVSPQVYIKNYTNKIYKEVIHLAVGCHYFLPGLRLPPQPQSILAGTHLY